MLTNLHLCCLHTQLEVFWRCGKCQYKLVASRTINAYVKLFSVDVGRGDEPTHLLRLSVKNRNTKLTKQNLIYSSFLWLCLNVLFSALCVLEPIITIAMNVAVSICCRFAFY